MAFDIERHLEARFARRQSAELRHAARIERREDQAAAMVGELCRNGRAVYYVWPAGGKYREGSRPELVSFLLRNRYA